MDHDAAIVNVVGKVSRSIIRGDMHDTSRELGQMMQDIHRYHDRMRENLHETIA